MTQRNPWGPMRKPATRYASSNGCRRTWNATARTHAEIMHRPISMIRLSTISGRRSLAQDLPSVQNEHPLQPGMALPANAPTPHLCMRLMCSQNRNEVEAVKKELLKAGIPSETRPHPVAEALGVNGLELWIQNERDFFDASKLYARLQGRAPSNLEV